MIYLSNSDTPVKTKWNQNKFTAAVNFQLFSSDIITKNIEMYAHIIDIYNRFSFSKT